MINGQKNLAILRSLSPSLEEVFFLVCEFKSQSLVRTLLRQLHCKTMRVCYPRGFSLDYHDIISRLIENVTSIRCSFPWLESLQNNESDVVFTMAIHEEAERTVYGVPVIMGSNVYEIVNLIRLDEVKFQEKMAVLENFQSLSLSVYLACAVLIVMMITLVITRVLMHHYLSSRAKNEMRNIEDQSSDQQQTQTTVAKENQCIRTAVRLTKLVMRHLNDLFYYSSDDFAFISLLYCLLIFFMLTSINSLFSTNQLIINQPPLIKSYQELLDHSTARPLLFGEEIDRVFESSPPGSIENRIFKEHKRFLETRNPQKKYPVLFSMVHDKTVIIFESDLQHFLTLIYCFISAELDFGILRAETFIDPNETEHLTGFAVSRRIITETLTLKLYRISSSGLSSHFNDLMLRETEEVERAKAKATHDMAYFYGQRRACSDTFEKEPPEGQVESFTFPHIYALGKIVIIMYASAGLFLTVEIVLGLASMA